MLLLFQVFRLQEVRDEDGQPLEDHRVRRWKVGVFIYIVLILLGLVQAVKLFHTI